MLTQKTLIIQTLIKSEINISPAVLNMIMSLDNPFQSLEMLIREVSFIPQFQSHITPEILNKLSNKKLLKLLQRKELENKKEDHVLKKNKTEVNTGSKTSKKLTTKSMQESTHFESQLNQSIEEKSYNAKGSTRLYESTKSHSLYRPISKDYDADYKILKDPTGKLYTNGDYTDFYNLTLDKFTTLNKLMRKRSDVLSATNINNILRLSNSSEVSTIGLVKNFRETKNQNFFFEIEDLTGSINVLIRKDNDNQDNRKLFNHLVYDQMLYVQGTYNPGDNRGRGIIFADYITKIDIPTNYQPNMTDLPLSIALISDTHIGSKEFEEKLFKRFIAFINGKIGNSTARKAASKIKYLVINGDLVDGIGVYPNQELDLEISDIYKQYEKACEFLSEIPEYITIFYTAGNHEPVRNAIPRPAVPKKYSEKLIDLGVICLGNPSYIQTHEVTSLIYHGESIHDMNLFIHDFNINKPTEPMKELLISRHLAPVFGEKTQIAPTDKDWLIIDKIPDIFHTGHIHINGYDRYRHVSLVNSGCFQAQTDFMKSFGIKPTPGIVPIIELDKLSFYPLDIKKMQN
jgi:DNA polymerase II small subunit